MTLLSTVVFLIYVHDKLPCRCMLYNATGWSRCRSFEEHIHRLQVFWA